MLNQLRDQEKVRYVGPFPFVVVYMGLGDHDSALRLLEEGISDHSYALRLKTEPVLLPLHSDPRFIALLHKAGFKD